MLPFCLDSDIMEILSLLFLFAPKISSVLEAFALILSLCPLHEFSLDQGASRQGLLHGWGWKHDFGERSNHCGKKPIDSHLYVYTHMILLPTSAFTKGRAFTQRWFYAERWFYKILQKDSSTQRCSYTEMLSTPRCFYTQVLQDAKNP